MPRTLPALALAALVALPLVAAEPAIPGLLQGVGTLRWFSFLPGDGFAFEGGAYDWTRLCEECHVRIAIEDGTWTYYDPARGSVSLAPGLYELREFRGIFFGNDAGLGEFPVEVHGLAEVERLG